ncbi:LapA family protein [Candidatus Sulfurimonas marisnigri]|uniref:LapA family protein n=1 Tax=Candidatus Sulfurimonas marisnigri TaxID=2740405 RepID=A0A7S7M2W0_9BACT|nr:LapA family protein [Candidatus Sulfurimonas marisnigri]QOY55653.1 LapA family protein [Candidatus Sulfurimonas marisnigri]
MNIKLASTLTLITLVIIFIFQNVAVVEIKFLFWSTQISRSLFIFFLLLIGIVIGWLLHIYYKDKSENKI